eukprot:ANDGO_00113.mRNA.1 Anaphase-promoting complex subunit cdc20
MSTPDRFIPNRNSMDMDASRLALSTSSIMSSESTPNENEYTSGLKTTLQLDSQSKVLAFRNKAPTPSSAAASQSSNLRVMYSANSAASAASAQKLASARNTRHIASTPMRILDAPELRDDFYLNLLDWSSQNNLAVALGQSVYVWNGETCEAKELLRVAADGDSVTSVAWTASGDYLAVGTNHSDVQLWDVRSERQVRSMKGHTGRVSSLAWNAHILSSGSKDASIMHHDVRIAQHRLATLRGHTQEVCGLKWSTDGTQLASGGNDNILNIYDGFEETPKFTKTEHTAAVKALAWCPWQQGLLASGGGTADRTLRFWNTQTGACVSSVDTQSQVCAIMWNPHDRELVTSHGFSLNQLCVWKYPSLTKVAELTGHTSRVLHLALSPDGTTVVSGAGDESLRFWKVFAAPEKSKAQAMQGSLMRSMNIR